MFAVVPLLAAGALLRADYYHAGPVPADGPADASVLALPSDGDLDGGVAPAPAEIGRHAASQVQVERPTSVELPDGAVMPVDVVATRRDGALELPSDIDRAGWWDGSSRIGDPFGAVVVAAHVDSFTQGVGPIATLLRARRGDMVELAGRQLTQRFRVVSAGLVPASSVTAAGARFSPYGAFRLVLVTCGGSYDAVAGSYRYNLVVVAAPVGPPVRA